PRPRSVATSPSPSRTTSSTAAIASRTPRRRLPCGSSRTSWSTGRRPTRPGSVANGPLPATGSLPMLTRTGARALLFLIVLVPAGRCADAPATGPWDVTELQKAPKVTWQDETGALRRLTYESEPRNGKPTHVFAYCAFPEKATGKLPAMVLVHGG